jgi:hypothetical protein
VSGIQIRAGLHTGEIELVTGSGIALRGRGSRPLKGVEGRMAAIGSGWSLTAQGAGVLVVRVAALERQVSGSSERPEQA